MTQRFYPVSDLAADEQLFNTAFRCAMEGRFCAPVMRETRHSDEMPLSYLLLQRQSDKAVVAAAKLCFFNDAMNVRYLATAIDCRGHGYGRRLFSALFSHAAGKVPYLMLSGYTPDGRDWLMPLEDRLARRHYPVLQVTHEMWCG